MRDCALAGLLVLVVIRRGVGARQILFRARVVHGRPLHSGQSGSEQDSPAAPRPGSGAKLRPFRVAQTPWAVEHIIGGVTTHEGEQIHRPAQRNLRRDLFLFLLKNNQARAPAHTEQNRTIDSVKVPRIRPLLHLLFSPIHVFSLFDTTSSQIIICSLYKSINSS